MPDTRIAPIMFKLVTAVSGLQIGSDQDTDTPQGSQILVTSVDAIDVEGHSSKQLRETYTSLDYDSWVEYWRVIDGQVDDTPRHCNLREFPDDQAEVIIGHVLRAWDEGE